MKKHLKYHNMLVTILKDLWFTDFWVDYFVHFPGNFGMYMNYFSLAMNKTQTLSERLGYSVQKNIVMQYSLHRCIWSQILHI